MTQLEEGDRVISLNAVKDLFCRICMESHLCYRSKETCEDLKLFDKLPSVNPQPKTGHWIWCIGSHKCSNCEEYTCFSHKELLRYCPNCGAKMSEIPTGSESEDEE